MSLVKNKKAATKDICATLWLNNEHLSSIFVLVDKLMQAPTEIDKWKESVAYSGAGLPLAFVLAHHPNANVDKITAGPD